MKTITFYKVDLDSLGDREKIETVNIEGWSTMDFADLLSNKRYDTRDDVVFEEGEDSN